MHLYIYTFMYVYIYIWAVAVEKRVQNTCERLKKNAIYKGR